MSTDSTSADSTESQTAPPSIHVNDTITLEDGTETKVKRVYEDASGGIRCKLVKHGDPSNMYVPESRVLGLIAEGVWGYETE
jgi:hypothetical protein